MYLERNPYTRKKTHLLHTVNIETEKNIYFLTMEKFFSMMKCMIISNYYAKIDLYILRN